MKRFKKLPVILGIVLSVMLVFGGVAFATNGFNFASVSADVTVRESVTVEMDGTGIWYMEEEWPGIVEIVGHEMIVTMPSAAPNEWVEIPVKAINDGYEDIDVKMVCEPENPDIFVTSDWEDAGDTVLGRCNDPSMAGTTHNVRVELDGDAVPGDYTVTFYFYRY